MTSPIWYRAPKDSAWDDVQSRKEAALWIAQKVLDDVENAPLFVDELMEQYGFTVIDENDTEDCAYCHEAKPAALLLWDNPHFVCEDCYRRAVRDD